MRQSFRGSAKVDIQAEIDRQWKEIKNEIKLPKRSSIAICIGSRGISNIVAIAKAVVIKLKQIGLKPFITSAMGSHGGASVEGQKEVLCSLGISENSVGAPIRITMDVVSLGECEGNSLYLDKLAYEADGIVLINRIKAHTDFVAPTESGLIKMMAIGLGNQVGADYCHRQAIDRGLYEVIVSIGRALIAQTPVLFGVGLVEDQNQTTSILRLILPRDIEKGEIELLKKAKEHMPRLPLNKIDLLIVDQMGKEISGVGLDPTVTGRYPSIFAMKRKLPKVARLFVRDLTEASKGNAIGIGLADFTTQRLVDKIDLKATAVNSVTSCSPEEARIPIAYPNDRAAIAAALTTIRPCPAEKLRIIRIKNTRDLTMLCVSEGCAPYLSQGVTSETDYFPLEFNAAGDLKELGW